MERAVSTPVSFAWAQKERLLRTAGCPERIIHRQKANHERRTATALRQRVEADLRKRGIL
jgi:hypothetical protein